jgi:hypothetical protein
MLAMTLLISSMLFWKILDLAVSTKGVYCTSGTKNSAKSSKSRIDDQSYSYLCYSRFIRSTRCHIVMTLHTKFLHILVIIKMKHP